MNIFTEAAKLEEQNCPFAMAQIVDSRGSTPRHSAQMLVCAPMVLSSVQLVVEWLSGR